MSETLSERLWRFLFGSLPKASAAAPHEQAVARTPPQERPAEGAEDASQPPQGEAEVAEAIERLRTAAAVEERVEAARILGSVLRTHVSQPAGAQDALLEAMRDEFAEVSVAALDALAERWDLLAHRLPEVLADPWFAPPVRARAARILGENKVLEPLLASVRDMNPDVSRACIEALAEIGSPSAVECLRAVAENADGFYLPETRMAAERAIEALGPERSER